MSLSRDQILRAEDIRTVEVKVPEWGGTVFVRTLSGTERDAYEFSLYQANKAGTIGLNARAKLVSLYACDESGAALFTEADVEALGKKNSAAIERIARAGNKLNAITERDIKDLEKN